MNGDARLPNITMIGCFLRDVSGVCPACFGVLFCSVVLGCRYTPSTTLQCSQWCPFVNYRGVFEYDIAHCRSVAVLYMLIRSDVTRFTLYIVIYLWFVYQCGLHAVLFSHIGTLMRPIAAEPRSSAGPLYSPFNVSVERSCWFCIRWCGTGGFQEQGQCFSLA